MKFSLHAMPSGALLSALVGRHIVAALNSCLGSLHLGEGTVAVQQAVHRGGGCGDNVSHEQGVGQGGRQPPQVTTWADCTAGNCCASYSFKYATRVLQLHVQPQVCPKGRAGAKYSGGVQFKPGYRWRKL
jgi:hypothetical protein